ncbi:MAG: heme-binding domain-containing protein [Ferruginibacter sp.]|nr:heme-binding domain-containing protein [Ferruginibacter sp.]
MLKRIFLVFVIIFIAIQFYRPAKNIAEGNSINDITTKYTVPENVQAILKKSCYDCHSNNTAYPWYNNIQPVASFLANHVKEGKDELNFSEFATYKIGRQYRKLEEIKKEIEENEMPLSSYTLIHTDANLNELQKNTITNWVNILRDSIKAQYPADSLVKQKRH